MRVLITGVCGFVGSTLARWLPESRCGLEIIGVDNLCRPGSEVNRRGLQDRGVRFIHGDIRQSSDVDELPRSDFVVDAAANPSVLAGVGIGGPRQLFEHNCLGTLNLLEYCRRYDAGFAMLSTSRVYSMKDLSALAMAASDSRFSPDFLRSTLEGVSAEGVSERFSTSAPLSLYGASKLASEVLALEYGCTFGFPVWVNRCGVMAGAGQFGKSDQGIFSFWIHSWLQRRLLRYIGFGGEGKQVRDCLHPKDLVPLLLLQFDAGSAEDKPRVVNVSGGLRSSISLRELSVWCAERLGPHLVVSDGADRRFDLPWVVLDSTLASRCWGWQPQISTIEICEEIAAHAEENLDWIHLSSGG